MKYDPMMDLVESLGKFSRSMEEIVSRMNGKKSAKREMMDDDDDEENMDE